VAVSRVGRHTHLTSQHAQAQVVSLSGGQGFHARLDQGLFQVAVVVSPTHRSFNVFHVDIVHILGLNAHVHTAYIRRLP